jgi:hypothetical protein
LLLNYNQQSINRISNLLTNIYNIEDINGNRYGDIRTNLQFRSQYGILLGELLPAIPIPVLKEPFVNQLISTIGQPPELQMNLINTMINLNTDEQILQLYTNVFNNKHILSSGSEQQFIPTIINFANNIINPPPTNTNTRTIDEVNRNLTYLTSLGLTKNSDNETMKKTLKRYKNLSGKNYSPSELNVSHDELEKDLKYLFSLGLTQDSGNETLNDRLAKWKALTGSDYVYSAEGGKRRKIRKMKTKRKHRKVRKSRK